MDKSIPDFENDNGLTDKQKRRRREYYAAREDNIRKTGEWQKANRGRVNEGRSKCRLKNIDKVRAYFREYARTYRVENKDRLSKYAKGPVFKATQKRYRVSVKTDAMMAYGGHCTCCGETRIEFLTLDHIHNDGAEKRRKGAGGGMKFYASLKVAGYPKGDLQVLCMNCNFSKGVYGYCPHREEAFKLLGLPFDRAQVVRTRVLILGDLPKAMPQQERKAGMRRKLAPEQVSELLELYRSGKHGIASLAARYSISIATVYATLNRLIQVNKAIESAV